MAPAKELRLSAEKVSVRRRWASDLRQAFVLRVVLAQIATLPLVVAGITVLTGGLEGLYWLVAGMVLSIVVALFEAWVLLVEINR